MRFIVSTGRCFVEKRSVVLVNPEVVEHEREVYRQKAREEGKPEQIIEKIAEGAVKKFCKDVHRPKINSTST